MIFSMVVRGLNHAEVIRAAVRARKNILVVGSTGSGKTTLVNAILDSLVHLAPNDRVISIEDTTELQCPVENYLDLRAVGGRDDARMPACMHAIEAHAHCRGRGAGRGGTHAAEGLEHRASRRCGDDPRQ